jgi:hypothetical protein
LEDIAFEVLSRHPPQRGSVVEELGDHTASVRVTLLLDLHKTNLGGLIDQDEIRVARGEAGLSPNYNRGAKL